MTEVPQDRPANYRLHVESPAETNDADEYKLGCQTLVAPKHRKMELIRPIDRSRMDAIRVAWERLGEFNEVCMLSEICETNYQSITAYCGNLHDSFAANRHRPQDFMSDCVQEINRLLLNYLAGFRAFLDHLETRYSRLQREGYRCLEDHKKILSACYDENFAYRFFYKLRNYVQHCGLPLGSMCIDESPAQNHSVEIDISVFFDRDNLISSYKGWGKLMGDLQAQPKKMDLIPYLNSFKSEIALIDQVVSAIEISLASDSWANLYELLNEVQTKYPSGMAFIGRLKKQERGKATLQMLEFPFHAMIKFQNKRDALNKHREQRKTKGAGVLNQ